MPVIHLTTFIEAPAEIVFDLSRSIELHKESMKSNKHEAVSGTRFGLVGQGDCVTWKGRHLFRTRLMRVRIIEMEKPLRIIKEQAEGSFRTMRHEYFFKPCENGTIMIEKLFYEAPYGAIGAFVNRLFLNRYLRMLLHRKNNSIKQYAESNHWRKFLQCA